MRVTATSSESTAANFFGEPATWRAEAAEALGIADDELPAAVSPGASLPTVLHNIAAALPSSSRMLVDIGSGLGGASEYLRRLTGARVVGVEPSEPARHTAGRCFPLLQQVAGVAAATGLTDECADAVVMCGVLSLLDEPHAVFTEAMRLLAPDGHLAIADLFATGRSDRHSAPNVFRTFDTVLGLCAAHDLRVDEVIAGRPTPDPEWAEIARRVDDWVERECRHRDGFDAWCSDQEHLHSHIANGDVVGGCVIAGR